MKPTASKLELVSKCAASAVLPERKSLSDASESGTALHEFLANLAQGMTREKALTFVPEKWRQAAADIDTESLPRLDEARVEVAFALDMTDGTGARVVGENVSREAAYSRLDDEEWAGTADIVGKRGDTLVIYDYKTGNAFHVTKAKDNLQLRFLAIAAARALNHHGDVEVGIIRTNGRTHLDKHVYDAFDLDDAYLKMRALYRRVEEARKNPNQFVVEGPHCGHCPAFDSCPAKQQLMRNLGIDASEVVEGIMRLSLSDVEKAYALWRSIKTVSHKLDTFFHMRAQGGDIPIGNGKAYGVVESQELAIDARIALEVVAEGFGAEAAKDVVEFSTSKARLERGLKAHVEKGMGAKVLRAVMTEIGNRGGIESRTKKVTREKEESIDSAEEQ